MQTTKEIADKNNKYYGKISTIKNGLKVAAKNTKLVDIQKVL